MNGICFQPACQQKGKSETFATYGPQEALGIYISSHGSLVSVWAFYKDKFPQNTEN